MLSLSYAYLLATLLFGILWLVPFVAKKDLRRKMLRASVAGAIAGPISQYWFLKDYWRPEYILGGSFGIIEDLLFSFFIFGFTVAMIHIPFRVKDAPKEDSRRKSGWVYVLALVFQVLAFLIFTDFFGINSIYSSAIGLALFALIMWHERPDLIRFSLLGGLGWVVLVLLGYRIILLIWPNFIDTWWAWDNISGIRIFQIPIEEFMWFGTWGLVGSIIYEWRHGFGFVEEERIAR
jgi:hypothetical protein